LNDSSPEILKTYRRMLMSRTNAERLVMGFELFTAGRELAIAGILAEKGAGHPAERLFLRLYGSDFDAEQRSKICALLRGSRDSRS